MKVTKVALLAMLLAFGHSIAQSLDSTESKLLDWIARHEANTLELIETTVNINSGTMNSAGVRAVGQVYRAEFERMGFETRWVSMPETMRRAGHFVASKKAGSGPKVLLIGHLDTVFEADESFQGYRRAGERAFGPGVSDMKAGNAVIVYALRALYELDLLDELQVAVIFTGDEENAGSPLSESKRDLIELAKWADFALGFEAGLSFDGSDWVTVSRRSSSNWYLEVEGRQAHSSKIFSEQVGDGAIFEAARILHQFNTQVKGEKYLTFNAGTIQGGTDVSYAFEENRGSTFGKTNVVPNKVIVHGDLRGLSAEQIERAERAMRSIVEKHSANTRANISFDHRYPPMAPTEGNLALSRLLSTINIDLGRQAMPILDPSRRGAADVSFAAPYADSLAGLGAIGSNAHTPEESLWVDSVPVAVQRAALLLYRLSKHKSVEMSH